VYAAQQAPLLSRMTGNAIGGYQAGKAVGGCI
jgi:hypothetical protein